MEAQSRPVRRTPPVHAGAAQPGMSSGGGDGHTTAVALPVLRLSLWVSTQSRPLLHSQSDPDAARDCAPEVDVTAWIT
jgi:hypothetical protein